MSDDASARDDLKAGYRAYRVEKPDDGAAVGTLTRLSPDTLPPGDVTVRVAYSSLNYKDALSARGKPGVTRRYPHTPGIDAAGTVAQSTDPRFGTGDEVIVTSYDLGVHTPGGFAELVRVPGDWVVRLPEGLSSREAMILGTAGLTAGLAVDALQAQGLVPDSGPVVVSGATGGVGCLAVGLLSGLGYEVVASTGKAQAHDWLRDLGAAEVIDRRELGEASERPLLKGRFGGGVDTVGGHTLANVLKSTGYGGSVAACGLVQSPELEVTVYPFILRGVSLLGIDSAHCPKERRQGIWRRLAGEWKPPGLERVVREIGLDELDGAVDEILQGRVRGRVLVRVAGEEA